MINYLKSVLLILIMGGFLPVIQAQSAAELLKCASESKKVLLLSATPIINKPNDMINLFENEKNIPI